MIHLGFEEIEKEPRKAMALCSSAMRDAIRRYGFAAVLDLTVRISNRDPIVKDSLPFLPGIAAAEMVADSSARPGSKMVSESPEDYVNKGEPLIIMAGWRTRK